MAAVTCTRSDLFPNGTVIKAYNRAAAHFAQQGAPTGASVAEATMTAGTCEFTGLLAGLEYTLYAEVGGKDTYLAVQAPASAAIIAATGLPEPALQKLLGYSFDPAMASGTFKPPTAGLLNLVRIALKEQVRISNILMFLNTKGAVLTAAQNLCGLFAEGTRKLIAEVAAATVLAEWEAANGSLLTLPLIAPVVAGPGYVTCGFFFNGTTAPTLASAPIATAALVNAGVSGANSRFGTGNAGLTNALPNPVEAGVIAAADPAWVGLS